MKEVIRPDLSFVSISLVGFELRNVLETSLRSLMSGRGEYLVWSNVVVEPGENPKIAVGKEPLMPHRIYSVCVEEDFLKEDTSFRSIRRRVLKNKKTLFINLRKGVEDYYAGVITVSRMGGRFPP